MPSYVQSPKLVRVPGLHCHVRASSTGGCAFVSFTIPGIEYSSAVSSFRAQGVWSKCKSCSDIAGTAKKCQELENQRKDEEGQEEEEVTEEPKRFVAQEMAREFSLFEEALLVFKA